MHTRTMIALGIGMLTVLPPASAYGQDPPAPTPTPEPQPFDVEAPSRKDGATVARITVPTFARRRLQSPKRGRRMGLDTVWSGQPQTLLVLDGATHEERDWVKVLLPSRPNGSTGWIPR